MARPPRLLCCLFLSLSLAAVARAATHHQEWEISYQFKSPDCVRKLEVTINGQMPGPTIHATQGDTVVVRVKNSLLTENVAIHWHGIRQLGTPWADGTEGVTQCPILPGDTFTYTFVVDRPGTYMYHAHYGMQRSAGLNGLIVVAAAPGGPDAEPFRYDGEHSVLLNDWWHKSTYEQATGLASVPMVWVGEPQSLLINGRGRFVNCSSMAAGACNATHPECATPVFAVVPGKTYRLRIASVTSLSALNFEIEDHEMTVVEADGHYVKPFVVKNLNIYSGETYSVLIKADQDPNRNYWLASNVVSRKPSTTTGTSILSFYGGRSSPRGPPPTTPPTRPAWNDTTYRFRQSVLTVAHPAHVEAPTPRADRTILLLNTQNKIDGRIKWALNNVYFALPHTPYLVATKNGLLGAFDQRPPPETYAHQGYDIYAVQKNPNTTTSDGLYRLQFGSVVDVVLQNANMLQANNSETHPWHLHGHDFWVLGYGIDRFDPAVHPATYNLKDPILKNTVAMHPYGWMALRFKADNPGVWAFHCHIEAHFFMGMGIVFEEGIERVAELPQEIIYAKPPNPNATTSDGLCRQHLPLRWVGEPHSLLSNGRVRFNCSAAMAATCNATLPECATPVFAVVPGKTYGFRIANLTSLSALNFEIEGQKDALIIFETANQNHKARLIAYANESITVVTSGTTRSRRPPIAYQQLGAMLVVVMLYLAAGRGSFPPSAAAARSCHPVAGQEPAAAEGTITRSAPAPSALDNQPVGGGHASPPHQPSTCSIGPADSNRSGAPSTPPSEGSFGTDEEDPSGPPASPPQRPAPPTVGARDNEGPLFTFVIALFAYDAAVVVGILHEFERIVGGWSTAPEVVYAVSAVLVIALLAVGFMAAWCHVSTMAGNSYMLWVSAFCVKLGAILSSDLLIVAISCKLGRWACVAGAVPSAAVITCIMAAVWIWGDEHAMANAVISICWGRIVSLSRRRQPAGDDMV